MYIRNASFVCLHSGGTNIEISTEGKVIECGQNLTLICKIKEYESIAAWMYENDVIPILDCVGKSCRINPNNLGKYEFTYDVNQGVFNLTIIHLSRNDIGKTYTCSDGYESDSEVISLEGKYFSVFIVVTFYIVVQFIIKIHVGNMPMSIQYITIYKILSTRSMFIITTDT